MVVVSVCGRNVMCREGKKKMMVMLMNFTVNTLMLMVVVSVTERKFMCREGKKKDDGDAHELHCQHSDADGCCLYHWEEIHVSRRQKKMMVNYLPEVWLSVSRCHYFDMMTWSSSMKTDYDTRINSGLFQLHQKLRVHQEGSAQEPFSRWQNRGASHFVIRWDIIYGCVILVCSENEWWVGELWVYYLQQTWWQVGRHSQDKTIAETEQGLPWQGLDQLDTEIQTHQDVPWADETIPFLSFWPVTRSVKRHSFFLPVDPDHRFWEWFEY